jgi:hypothetical protein
MRWRRHERITFDRCSTAGIVSRTVVAPKQVPRLRWRVVAAESRSLATALWGARFASGFLPASLSLGTRPPAETEPFRFAAATRSRVWGPAPESPRVGASFGPG